MSKITPEKERIFKDSLANFYAIIADVLHNQNRRDPSPKNLETYHKFMDKHFPDPYDPCDGCLERHLDECKGYLENCEFRNKNGIFYADGKRYYP